MSGLALSLACLNLNRSSKITWQVVQLVGEVVDIFYVEMCMEGV